MGIVAKQGIWSALYVITGFAIGAFNSMVLVPYVFDEGMPRDMYGLLQLITSLAIVFSQFLNFGAVSIPVRFMPRFRSENRKEEMYYFTWVFPGIGMLILALFLLVAGKWFISAMAAELLMDAGYLVLILFLHAFFMAYFRSLNGIAITNYQNTLGAFFNEVFIRIIQIGGVLLYAYGQLNFHQLFLYFALSYASQFLVMFFAVGGFSLLKIRKPADRKEFREISAFGLFSVFDSGANILINKLDVIMIGAIVGLSDIVYYQLAFFMATVISIPSRSLVNVSSAVVGEAVHRNDWNAIQKLYSSNSLHQTLGGGLIFLLIWLNMDAMLAFLPPEFEVIRYPFLFLGISKLIDMVTSINGVILSATPKYRYNFYFNVILLILAVITNFALLPFLGIDGAALATAFCVLIYNVLKARFLFVHFSLRTFHPKSALAVLCLSAAFAAGYFIPDISHAERSDEMAVQIKSALTNIILRSAVIVIVFGVLVWFTRVSEEIRKLGSRILAVFGIKTND